MKINRKYHHYEKWEDFQSGMYANVETKNKSEAFKKCLEFIKSDAFFNAMERVIYEWPFSCEQNLTNINSNRVAWIGQAACTIALAIPEDITRQAWGNLEKSKKRKANRKAELVISKWEKMYAGQSWQIRFKLDA
jgi:hypothetical protein